MITEDNPLLLLNKEPYLVYQAKTPLSRGFHMFSVRAYKPSSVLRPKRMESNLSGPIVANGLERHSPFAWSTALHSGKDLAVSPLELPQELIRSRGYSSLSI
jgi:hypothetical protein